MSAILSATVSNRPIDCPNCRLRYKIDDGIPVMLIDEAEKF